MEKDFDQLELFSQGGGPNQASPRASRAFMARISKYEKLILMVFAFAVTGIVSFSIGVERGKRYAMPRSDSRFDVAANAVKPAVTTAALPQPQPASTPKQAITIAQPQNQLSTQKNEVTMNYTIQVASFSSKINAQKEVESLRKKGLSPLVLSRGKFSIVCVGNFSRREEAESLLPKLKKQYQDCRVRRL